MTDKEIVERYKMALEAIALAAYSGVANSTIMNIAKKALEAKKCLDS